MPLGPPSSPQVLSRTPETMVWLGALVAKSLTVKENTLKPGWAGSLGAAGTFPRSGPECSLHVPA